MNGIRISKHLSSGEIGLAIFPRQKHLLVSGLFSSCSYLGDLDITSINSSLPPDNMVYFASFKCIVQRKLHGLPPLYPVNDLSFAMAGQNTPVGIDNEIPVEMMDHGRGLIFSNANNALKFLGETFVERQHDEFEMPVAKLQNDQMLFISIKGLVGDNQRYPISVVSRSEILRVYIFPSDGENSKGFESTVSGLSSSLALKAESLQDTGSECIPRTKRRKSSEEKEQVKVHGQIDHSEDSFCRDETTDYNDDHFVEEHDAKQNSKGDRRKARGLLSNSNNGDYSERLVNGSHSANISEPTSDQQSQDLIPAHLIDKEREDLDLRELVVKNAVFPIILNRLIHKHYWYYDYATSQRFIKDLIVPDCGEEVYFRPNRSKNTRGMKWGVDCFYSHDTVIEYLKNLFAIDRPSRRNSRRMK